MISGNTIVAPVTTTDVRNLTGCPSNSVNYLITAAKTGGVNGRAFNTTLGGGNEFLGELITGARPYWNIFSNDSPGEWSASPLGDGPLIFRIKREVNSARYVPTLGGFRNYKHNAIGPEDYKATVEVAVGSTDKRVIAIRFRTGDYDWRKISNTNAAMFLVYKNGMQIASSPVVALTNVNMTIVTNVTLPISTSSPHTEIFTVRLLIGRVVAINDFNSFGYIPMEGTITVIVYRPLPPVVFYTELSDLPAGSIRMGTDVISFPKYWACTGTYIGTDYKERHLYKVIYKIVNSEGAVGNTVTITSNFDWESETPYYFDYGRDTGTNTFVQTASNSRLVATAEYPQLRIEMYYQR